MNKINLLIITLLTTISFQASAYSTSMGCQFLVGNNKQAVGFDGWDYVYFGWSLPKANGWQPKSNIISFTNIVRGIFDNTEETRKLAGSAQTFEGLKVIFEEDKRFEVSTDDGKFSLTTTFSEGQYKGTFSVQLAPENAIVFAAAESRVYFNRFENYPLACSRSN